MNSFFNVEVSSTPRSITVDFATEPVDESEIYIGCTWGKYTIEGKLQIGVDL